MKRRNSTPLADRTAALRPLERRAQFSVRGLLEARTVNRPQGRGRGPLHATKSMLYPRHFGALCAPETGDSLEKVGMARCAVRAAYQRRNASLVSRGRTTPVPPAGTRAGTSQRDVPTSLRFMGRENRRPRSITSIGMEFLIPSVPARWLRPRTGALPASLKTFAALVLMLLVAGFVAAAEFPGKPNIIFILADDLGYGEIGCYGQKLIATPRIDGMARDGMRFTQFYAGATVCAPSRSVLMTGQHHGHTRVRGNAGKANPLAQALRSNDVTVARVLQSAGYKTALIGKWGLGDVGEAESGLPRRHGFDYFFGFLNQHHAHNHYPEYLWRNEEKVALPNDRIAVGDQGGGYATNGTVYADDLFADEAVKFISGNQEEPFFLFLSLVVPHANNERNRELKNGAEVPDFGPYADRPWPAPDKGHAAMVSRMDGYVGRVLDEVRRLRLERRTLVIFTSDNGPHKESGHQAERFEPEGPLRGYKRELTEGGIRVPLIAWWPGHVKSNQVSGHVGYFGDLMATAAALAGSVPPSNIDSISFLPALHSRNPEQRAHKFLYFEFHEGGFSQAAVMDGRWKGIRSNSLNGPLQIYDLKSDPGEARDLAPREPAVMSRIDAFLKTARSESPDWPVRLAPAGAGTQRDRRQRQRQGAFLSKPRVLVQTTLGEIELELEPNAAPVTVTNFLHYVEKGLYSDGLFHRTVTLSNQPTSQVKIEVIQGAANPAMTKRFFAPIPIERTRDTGLKHLDGTLSMARDGPDTAQDEFFVCIGDQPELDFGGKRNPDGQGFAAFGRVTKGMEVVRRIQQSAAEEQNLTPPIRVQRMVRLN
jgi:arylsulfatase A-like enzyme/cyclophilin family peptidyl-prolyl cis-trans isomerase